LRVPVRLTDALPDVAPAVAFTASLRARRGYSARDLSRVFILTTEQSRMITTQARSSPPESDQGKARVAVTDSRDRRSGTPNPGLGMWARHRHRDVSGGWLRPTVFGAVDGLVTNASLIAGVGGGGVSAHTIVLTGLAGLVAGAFSMGTGEYVSVTNQNELVHAEVALERDMHDRFPEQEHAELAERFTTYGADPDTARRMAEAVSQDPDRALWLHARDELGVDPHDLPSPLLAGGASWVAFSLGALWPLLPYLLGFGALPAALGLTAVALLAGGVTVGRLTGRPLLRAGLRQLTLGALAVAVTYGVGHLIGASAA
jgi:VIT1/CCC1 family predicted Fe2+/Mn2+ transporter